MDNDFTVDIKGFTLEYFASEHIYLVDGLILPSVTKLLSRRFSGKYDGIPKRILKQAAHAGTAVHEAIENYCVNGAESDLPELRNFKFLKKHHGFKVIGNEVPVILFNDGEPVAAGRLDLVLEQDGKIGGADIKRTATLDKMSLAYQLNLYRTAYAQSYGVEWEFLKGIHLRGETVRKYVDIPIDESLVDEIITAWRDRT